MTWKIEFAPKAEREIAKLEPQAVHRILRFLHERVACLDNPRSIGEPLKGPSLGEFWRYRVGRYRIVANIEDDLMRVIVLRVGDRREVYRKHLSS